MAIIGPHVTGWTTDNLWLESRQGMEIFFSPKYPAFYSMETAGSFAKGIVAGALSLPLTSI
jgi:hypothetical protein